MTGETRTYWESSFIGTGRESSATDLVTFLGKQMHEISFSDAVYGMMIISIF